MELKRMFSTAIMAVALIAMCQVPKARAHMCVTDPPARMATSGSHSRMCGPDSSGHGAYDLSAGNCNTGAGQGGCGATWVKDKDVSVCGGPFQESSFNPAYLTFSAKKNLLSGSLVTFKTYYRAVHTWGNTPGWVEVRLCTQGGQTLTQTCFNQYQLAASSGGYRAEQPLWMKDPTDGSGSWMSYSFYLPSGVTCDKCVLQYRWYTSSYNGGGGELFHNCMDVTISSGGNPGTSVPAPVPPSPPPPVTSGGSPPGGTCNANSVCSTGGVKAAPCACSSDCTKFVNCANGVGYLQPCGSGLVYNPNGYCDWPANYKCPC